EKGEAPSSALLAGLKKRDRAWERRQVFAWHGSRYLPLNSAMQSDSISYPDFFNKDKNEYANAILKGMPFKEIVRDKGELYLRAASSFMVGPEKLIVVTSEPLDQTLMTDIAANLGEITLYAAGIGQDQEPKPAEKKDTAPKTSAPAGSDKGNKSITFSDSKPGSPNAKDEQILRPTFSV